MFPSKLAPRTDLNTDEVRQRERWARLAAAPRKISGARDGLAVTKLPGQGAFDNIHIAQKVIFESVLKDKRWANTHPDRVSMAPFCAHDCMHTHWRWGDAGSSDRWIKGWSNGFPYSKSGSPLVPENQEVEVKLVAGGAPRAFPGINAATFIASPNGFEYAATAHDVDMLAWQYFYHHGSGYAVHMERSFDQFAGALSVNRYGLVSNWASAYMMMRYDPGLLNLASAITERVQMVGATAAARAGSLNKLRGG